MDKILNVINVTKKTETVVLTVLKGLTDICTKPRNLQETCFTITSCSTLKTRI